MCLSTKYSIFSLITTLRAFTPHHPSLSFGLVRPRSIFPASQLSQKYISQNIGRGEPGGGRSRTASHSTTMSSAGNKHVTEWLQHIERIAGSALRRSKTLKAWLHRADSHNHLRPTSSQSRKHIPTPQQFQWHFVEPKGFTKLWMTLCIFPEQVRCLCAEMWNIPGQSSQRSSAPCIGCCYHWSSAFQNGWMYIM